MHHRLPALSKDALLQAINLEQVTGRRFRDWALRLRPFDIGIRQLFEQLAAEMDGYRRELLFQAERLTAHRASRSLRRAADGHREPAPEHFFVVDLGGAIAILDAALHLMVRARETYRHLCDAEPHGSLLGGLYKNLASFKELHVQMLQEAIERCALRLTWPTIMTHGMAAARVPAH